MNPVAWLFIGASVTAGTCSTSPADVVAERLNVPVVVSARGGLPLSKSLPSDEMIRSAAMVVMLDGLYWSANLWPCDTELDALHRLLYARGGKPMILATIPEGEGWTKGRCTEVINQTIRASGYTVLELNGALLPPGLHPERSYVERIVNLLMGYATLGEGG